jgi:hypothetical protein
MELEAVGEAARQPLVALLEEECLEHDSARCLHCKEQAQELP